MLVHDIQSILPSFLFTLIMHVFTEGNVVTDWIANLQCLIRFRTIFSTSPFPKFSCIITDDYLGRIVE